MRTETPILTDLPIIAGTVEAPLFPIVIDRSHSIVVVVM
jgi:hypothetical protein